MFNLSSVRSSSYLVTPYCTSHSSYLPTRSRCPPKTRLTHSLKKRLKSATTSASQNLTSMNHSKLPNTSTFLPSCSCFTFSCTTICGRKFSAAVKKLACQGAKTWTGKDWAIAMSKSSRATATKCKKRSRSLTKTLRNCWKRNRRIYSNSTRAIKSFPS